MTLRIAYDCSYLCHRAFYALPSLSHAGAPTSAIYGFFQTVVELQNRFAPDGPPVFCFDSDPPRKREQLFPGYKFKSCVTNDPQKAKVKADLRVQIRKLRDSYLSQVGFRNVFYAPGYEADDVLAQVAAATGTKDELIMISSDQDLFQLLRGNVSMYDPRKKHLITSKVFEGMYGISPEGWATIKALAGCTSDCVPGVRGVGEATALKFVRNATVLRPTIASRIRNAITSGEVEKTMQLVKLPFEGTPPVRFRKDAFNRGAWLHLVEELGMDSLTRAWS